jgi:hypothetical protein
MVSSSKSGIKSMDDKGAISLQDPIRNNSDSKVTGYGTVCPVFDSRKAGGSYHVQTRPLILCLFEALSSGVNRSEREADNSHLATRLLIPRPLLQLQEVRFGHREWGSVPDKSRIFTSLRYVQTQSPIVWVPVPFSYMQCQD